MINDYSLLQYHVCMYMYTQDLYIYIIYRGQRIYVNIEARKLLLWNPNLASASLLYFEKEGLRNCNTTSSFVGIQIQP